MAILSLSVTEVLLLAKELMILKVSVSYLTELVEKI